MAHTFKLNKESLKRWFAVYVVIIITPQKKKKKIILYVGKTGDNRDGCNPIISRCGNHFSYNYIHAQIRKIVEKHKESVEKCDYIYVFDHFNKYVEGESEEKRKEKIDKINEMERWLNKEIQKKIENINSRIKSTTNLTLDNPLKNYLTDSTSHVSKEEKKKRKKFRIKKNEQKIDGIVNMVDSELEELLSV